MINIDDITYLSRKKSQKIKADTHFLLKEFGISYFAFQTVSKEGLWNLVGNNPAWLEYSAGNEFYHFDPSLINPDHYQTGVTYAPAHEDPEFQSRLINHAVKIFDIDHCLALIKKTDSGCEFAFFATAHKNKGIISKYVSQLQMLWDYVNFFKLENQKLLRLNENYNVDLTVLKPESYAGTKGILKVEQEAFSQGQVRLEMPVILTPRERECLNFYVKGRTAKETAIALNLSHRTVEEHLNNLKNKLGCKHKRDLLAKSL